MQELRVQSLGREDLLKKEMATHTSILAWEIPWTEWSVELQRVRNDLSMKQDLLLDPSAGKMFLNNSVTWV